MGGGDLNLKKSWHPSTLRNIERVWKVEQKHEAEKQKIEQLQKELAEERAREEIQQFAEDQGVIKKKEEKLEFIYQGPAAMVNREEYLLGCKIDSSFETLQNGGDSHKDKGTEARSMFSCQNLSGTATVDLANKIREDPLFNIMKKKKEERKFFFTNPVKMKQLQQLHKSKYKAMDPPAIERNVYIGSHGKKRSRRPSDYRDSHYQIAYDTKNHADHGA
ncbi:Pre-mRNA-splicing factor CWC25 [Araneus ventricosus]|uniref:Pre-mRNA-splicing factor CWC25 n=1 Tax=Araneus ventricosus TaxID=182803 RepID=A0A4Y2P2T4_ARAVE|nr:Pre-mRNA-splicing factor CWC25 [Araneus ventricosus]